MFCRVWQEERVFAKGAWGFPGETAKEYEEMTALIPLISHLIPPVGIFKLALARNSPLHRDPEKWGLSGIRPLPAYKDAFPPWTDADSLAYYFLCDFSAETFDRPEVMEQFIAQVDQWNTGWQNPVIRPHLLLARSGKGDLTLLDTRNLGQPIQTIVSPEEAAVLMENAPYAETALQEWALERQAALVSGGEFVPLATMEYSLKKELEYDREHQRQVHLG